MKDINSVEEVYSDPNNVALDSQRNASYNLGYWDGYRAAIKNVKAELLLNKRPELVEPKPHLYIVGAHEHE